jgi:CHAT domain-containing protein/tetratricopeptide (TPR) repeat protein
MIGYLKACLAMLLVIGITFPLIAEETITFEPKAESRKAKSKIEYIIHLARTFRKAEKFDKASILLNEVLKEFTNKENQRKLQIELADLHFWWAHSLKKTYDHRNAIKHFERAYVIDKVHRPKYSAIELNNAGFLYYTLDQNRKALEYYEKALAILKALGDQVGEAKTLNNIGIAYSDLGQQQKALEYYEKAFPIIQEKGVPAEKGALLKNIGAVHEALGQKREAIKYYEEALSIIQEVGSRTREADLLRSIGALYYILGHNRKALGYHKKALVITKELGDRAGEIILLNNIGVVYFEFGQKQKALQYYEEALQIIKAVGNRAGEATTLNNIGTAYSDLGQKQKALEYFEKALSIRQKVGDQVGEAEALNNIGRVYFAFGQKQKALGYFEKALQINQVIGNKSEEANTFNHIGLVYDTLGQKQEALYYLEKALKILKPIEGQANWFKIAAILNSIGNVYGTLGQKRKALRYFEEALKMSQAVENETGEAAVLSNIGYMYAELGQKHNAMKYYEKALQIIQNIGDKNGEAMTINNIAGIYITLGQRHKALYYCEKALQMIQNVGDKAAEAMTLNNIGGIYLVLDQKQKALDYYEKVLPLWRVGGYKPGEAETLSNFMFFWNNLKHSLLSIFYGKQAVNAYQRIRTNLANLDKEIRQSYIGEKKDSYRKLADLLIISGRLLEAQQVLDMLKEQEYFEYILKDASSADILSTQADYTEFENLWLKKQNRVIDTFSSTSNEYHLLEFKENKNENDIKRIEELEITLKDAKRNYEAFLDQLKAAFDKHKKEMKEKPDTATLTTKASKLQRTIKHLDEIESGRNAALHYLVHDGRISVILTTASSQSVKQTNIDEQELNLMIMDYRNLTIKLGELMRGVGPVKNPNNILEGLIQKKKEYERKLYDVIFKPVDAELIKYGATNLMISLDGVLRYIPLAALWDGETYLVQRYRIALITPSSLRNIKDEPVEEKKILGLGASRGGQGFAPLPYVRREIRSIVKDDKKGYEGLINGRAFIDDDFTKDTMINQMKNKTYPLVHISSHFKFSPGDETKNHLLLGDGTIMKLSEIRRMGKLFDNVKLLVLSACQTGVGGNGEEIDGFGELAQQSGARSVIASLWPVADESTKDLMVNFYLIMKEGKETSKIESLRQAQLELAGLEDLLGKDKRGKSRLAKKETKYSHSYYWGPFIMIGNWR